MVICVTFSVRKCQATWTSVSLLELTSSFTYRCNAAIIEKLSSIVILYSRKTLEAIVNVIKLDTLETFLAS